MGWPDTRELQVPITSHQVLPATFYQRPAEVVARDLLGCRLLRRWRGIDLVCRIVETEAYLPERDAASHAHRGRTRRNDPMFGPAGRAYVYFIYGMYDMLNVVCDSPDVPSAVLLRAAQPLDGAEHMQRWRGVRRVEDIANGPGKLCRALRISRSLNRHVLWRSPLWILSGGLSADESIARSRRIGVSYAGTDASLPLRFFIRDHPHVSPHRQTG
jgi:DNA-3-methyladenine glycosylase